MNKEGYFGKELIEQSGLFNSVPLTGKDISLDHYIDDCKINLINTQIIIEAVYLNGDLKKAQQDIAKSK